jgi:hypothetical protein
MGWVRLEDDFYDNGKFASAGPLGTALWVVGLAWSNRNLTDGVIPESVARRLVDWKGTHWRAWEGELVGSCEEPANTDVAEHLVAIGLWEYHDGGYLIHDYHDYQPKAATVKAARDKNAERMRKWRESHGKDSNEDGDRA